MRFSVYFVLLLLTSFYGVSYVYAEQSNNVLGQLFFSPQERMKIEKERDAYQKGKDVLVEQLKQDKLITKLPKEISVTSILIDNAGRKKVRINGEFQSPRTPVWSLDLKQTTQLQAVFYIQNKRVSIPVGYTYLTETKMLKRNSDLTKIISPPLPEDLAPQDTTEQSVDKMQRVPGQ